MYVTKGMGDLGPLAPGTSCTGYDSDPSSPTYDQCVSSAPTTVSNAYGTWTGADVQNLVDTLQSYLPSSSGGGVTSWLNAHSTLVAVGAGAFVLAMLFAGGGRR